jgi:hypothetical protein
LIAASSKTLGGVDESLEDLHPTKAQAAAAATTNQDDLATRGKLGLRTSTMRRWYDADEELDKTQPINVAIAARPVVFAAVACSAVVAFRESKGRLCLMLAGPSVVRSFRLDRRVSL